MPKGAVFPSESMNRIDPERGVGVRQITTNGSIHHHPFYYIPAYDDAMQWLFFISHRPGKPQIFAEERSTGRLVQLTDRSDLNEWSIHPAHNGEFVYFTAGDRAWRVRMDNLSEECLATFDGESMVPSAMVADGMGTTALSHDDRWWAVPARRRSAAQLHVIDTSSGRTAVILEHETICHPEFHPRDAFLLRYGGPYQNRLWVVNRDGTGHRLIYRRLVSRKEWIVHELWHPLRREVLAVNWPHGMIGVDADTGFVRRVCSFNVWHGMINRGGSLMVCDTNCPDRGLQLFNPNDGKGLPRRLCNSGASNQGAHWHTEHCPYDDGPVEVYAPQHTHPHPQFSPDGNEVVFTSDRTGVAQVYEVEVSAG